MTPFLFSSAIGALPVAIQRFRMRCHSIPALLMLGCACALGGEAYFTGFENFTAGNDTIIGTDSWTGSYAGKLLHGVMSEAEHGVVGLGKVAFIGGYATSIAKSGNSNSVYVSKAVNLDPVALNEQIATFSVVFGIKDSSSSTRRDNFEFLIYNQSGSPLAGLQFDNSTLDTSTGKPRRLIYRLSWNSEIGSLQYVLTSFNFLPESLEKMEFQIDYGTNVWTASLSDVPIFEDIPFYTGAATKNLGSVVARMTVSNVTTSNILPGDNYMLFDDFTIRTDAPAPAIKIEQPSGTALTSGSGTLNFGSGLLGSPVPLTVTIKNVGEAPLSGIGFSLNGANAADFSFSAAPAAPIAVGGSATFDVTFTPLGTGSRVAALHIASNDASANPFDINLSGTGLVVPSPVIGIEQPSGSSLASGTSTVSFGSGLLGSPSSRTVTIRNSGLAPLTGIGFSLDGTNSADFSFTAAPAAPIAVGGSATFDVTFTPSGTGSRVAVLHIASNDPFTNPFDINLAGTGLGVPEIAVEQPAGTDLTDGAPATGFGNIVLGADASRTFTIKNTGTADLTGLAVASDGTNAAEFTVTADPASSVAPGGNTTFTVRFKPAAAGVRNAAIHIASNDANENPFDITLTGTGIGIPEIEVRQPAGTNLTDNVSSKSFGSVVVKSKVTKTFTIKNTGTATLKSLAITKNGKHAKNFTVTKPLKTSLSPGTSTTFKVTFKPSAKGTRKAAIHIACNDGNENPFDIALTGKGVAAKSSASPAGSNTSVKSANKIVSLASTIRVRDRKYACITIPRDANGEPGQESVEVSSNLVDWFSGPNHTKVLKDTAELLKVRDKTPMEPGNKRFIRLKQQP